MKNSARILAAANTPENAAIIEALKKVAETSWSGNLGFENIEAALASLRLGTFNSGWYNPSAVKINGLTGFFMLNQNGSINYEFRIIKEDDKKFKTEYMTNSALNEFERNYSKLINAAENA